MKVTVSVFGRFHAFYLAEQLAKRGHLRRLITTYPRFEVRKYNVPMDRVTSLPLAEVLQRSWRHMPQPVQECYRPEPWIHGLFERSAARHVPEDTEIYVGWSGYSEQGLEHARHIGAATVVERGSAHIETQRDILTEEYHLWGVRGELPHPRVVEKELREYELADRVCVPSTFASRTFIERGFPAERILRVPLGVNVGQFTPRDSADRTFRVLHVGAISLRKGVGYLLQAFHELRLPDAELLLIGNCSAEMAPVLQRFRGVYRHVPAVPQAELPAYYRRGAVLALCSVEDGMGMVVPQAMASGLPVICTTNSTGGDLITHGREGFVLPIRAVELLKETLLFLYEHRDAAWEMGRAGCERVLNTGTWDQYGDEISCQYSLLLGRHGAVGRS